MSTICNVSGYTIGRQSYLIILTDFKFADMGLKYGRITYWCHHCQRKPHAPLHEKQLLHRVLKCILSLPLD